MQIVGDVTLYSDPAPIMSPNLFATSATTGNTSLRMVQTADTSLSQFVSFPENPLAIVFDLFVESAHPGDVLNVYLGNALLQPFTLSELPAFGSYSIDISQLGLLSGDITFHLEGPVEDPSSIRLDNLDITAVPNHAPVLEDRDLTLPVIDLDAPSATNAGRAVATLLDGLTDSDVTDGRGLAIVGTNEIAGLIQYSLDDGVTWNNVGVVAENSALLLSDDPAIRIRLLPNGSFAGDVANVVTFLAWDQTTGIAGLSGEYYDATVTGTNSPFSAATDLISIHIESTADLTPPSSAVDSLPATTTLAQFTVTWSGSDNAGGSGIATYSVFVSENGGDYAPFVLNTVNTSALFNGQVGHLYRFYSTATDNASNVETAPGVPDAETTVVAGNQAPDILDAIFSMPENSIIGSTAGTPVATDPDVGDTLTYSIFDGNASGAFAIDPVTGTIAVANQAALDFETTPAFNLSVRAMDNHGASDTASVTINLTDVVEVPQLILGGDDVTWIKKRPAVTVLPQLTVGGTATLVGGSLTISLNVISTAKKLLDQIHIPAFNGLGSSPGAHVINGRLTLAILLNAGATNASLESFLKGITFATKGKGLKAPTRTMTVTLATLGGATASVTQSIHVRKKV